MSRLSVLRLGFALAAASALTYLGCVLVMATVPQDVAVRFFNSLLHGVDVEPIMRWEMPWWEMAIGVLETFVLAWLFGALVAALYNVTIKES